MDVWRSSREHRTTGHAAEMAFFAVLTLVPSTVAVGAALGLSKHVIGESTVTQAEDAAIDAVRAMMGPDLADTVISPFVHAQLAQVTIIGQSVNAVVATVLWAYLASIAILVGGEFNAALRARRPSRVPTGRFSRRELSPDAAAEADRVDAPPAGIARP